MLKRQKIADRRQPARTFAPPDRRLQLLHQQVKPIRQQVTKPPFKMAPHKRKPADDFIYTLSDNEDAPVDPIEAEAVAAQPPKKKAKTAKKPKAAKKAKKPSHDDDAPEGDEEAEEALGVWGQRDEDDGAMDSDFEFVADKDESGDEEEFAGWGFEGAKSGIASGRRGVDIDDIIRRRRERKNGKDSGEAIEEVDGDAADDQADAIDVDMDDDDDEVLAEDAFGMNADSDADEEPEKRGDEEASDDDSPASDDDSVATPVGHPDDDMSGAGDNDQDEDPEEQAKRDAFFAVEEMQKPGQKTDVSSFMALSLSRPILRGLAALGFSKPTPIQSKTIPIALMGKDLVGGAVTGSGKTGAFMIPILERLLYRPNKVPTTRVVVLTPTRELAMQCYAVATKLASHTDIKFSLAVGGLSLKVQEAELRRRPDVVIGTPGRFIDHMRNSASFNVDTVEILVLDEADRMLEDGFADELNEILTTLPKSRQTMLFSATMTSTVDRLIRVGLNKPVRLMVDGQKKTVGTLVQEFVRLRPGREEKRMGYLIHLCKELYRERVIIFFRQKKAAHRARIIFGLLDMSAAELHGSMNQTMRIESVESFRDGKVSFLLATDLASRGLDIKGVDTVINYEAPQSQEIYVHRVGRTARAGRQGVAVTLAAEADRKVVKAAVKAGKAQGAKISQLNIPMADADKWQAQIDEMDEEIEEIMREEKEEKQFANAEMQVRKGENMMQHEAEIKSRPKRTWFETQHEKDKAKQAGRDELNGAREAMKKKKGGGKLSNKDKKRLDAKAVRSEGSLWKKGKSSEPARGAGGRPASRGSGSGSGRGRGRAQRSDAGTPARQVPASATRAACASRGSPTWLLTATRTQAGRELSEDGLTPGAGRGRRLSGGLVRHRSAETHNFKLAPFRFFAGPGPGPLQPHLHPRQGQSLLRYVLPRAVRDRYRERLLSFRLDTLPHLKHSVQARIHRCILGRQSRRADQSRVLDLVARHGRRLLLGPPPGRRPAKDARQRSRAQAKHKMPPVGGLTPGYAPGAADASQDVGERGERGYRRRKLAAMAGNLYRSGQQAVTEIRESYAQSRARGVDGVAVQGSTHIPGAFPDVAITSQGDEQMVLFPSYAKRHIKKDWSQIQANPPQIHQTGTKDEEYWRQEWEKNEDQKAIVDVDVRGWIYSPHVGPMTRRNRILIGLARQLSGISTPRPDQSPSPMAAGQPPSHHEMHEAMHDQEKIAQEAALIERRGQEGKRVAYSGGYSEQPQENAVPGTETMLPYRGHRRESHTPDSAPGSPVFSARQSPNVHELTEAELVVANANLMARVAPFMTNPLVALPITIFFYNETQSQSRTVLTNDAGHFIVRAPLDFIPTSVRVLANEKLSATQEIKITEPRGVSLISDVDDTIKHSNISAGAREIFRNTFVRELGDLTVDGVKEWYNQMHDLGVSIHYCSNSPWQLFPVLASFFKQGGLPPGSLHLKQYSGMLQGIFEPVAERKKTTLNRLMRDFPKRRFILVGDSGEADLEVYTELALANPGRILAVFIRDVTTPERTGYFDSSFELTRGKSSSLNLDDARPISRGSTFRQKSAPVAAIDDKTPTGPVMGTLIDFSEEPEEVKLDEAAALEQVKKSNLNKGASATDLLSARRPPPPRPVKPAALRSTPSSTAETGGQGVGLGLMDNTPESTEAPPPPPRRAAGGGGLLHPLSQMQNSSQQTVLSSNTTPQAATAPVTDPQPADSPPPPLPRRRAAPSLKSLSPRLFGHGRGPSSNSDVDFDPLPPSAAPPPSLGLSYYRSGSRSGATTPSGGSPTLGAQGVNKKLELWKRRLARAHEVLDQQGVALYTWRRGQDVCVEAVAIVRQALQDMDEEGGRRTPRRK
ncbi:Uncharacterized protein TPAR_02282 [Tolypocladium paradoxum]|uniref:ATP-dependent RNA helicase DRS1 n=1 Tax=Tolypocladium paradoxum TaxID=94208 RepID=A0A2S4L4X7_9HYPO|nr:Uncharacterized protein TPAR_02282 [Tolypocladium paradoxum]